jgi:hypothetical protein
MRRMLVALTALSALAAASAAVPAVASKPGTETRAAATNVYGLYSLMLVRSAGQYHSGGKASGQWAWKPITRTVSDITWGDPKAWPPKYAERFVLGGGWVQVDGYSAGPGKPVTQVQRVSYEAIGDGSCRNMRRFGAPGSRQHYVKWTIPSTGYCLDARGGIRNTATGKVVHFRHVQQWGPPRMCSNAYHRNRACITQHEMWWDDNGKPWGLRIKRTQWIARGLGHAFMIRSTVPVNWGADGRFFWRW